VRLLSSREWQSRVYNMALLAEAIPRHLGVQTLPSWRRAASQLTLVEDAPAVKSNFISGAVAQGQTGNAR